MIAACLKLEWLPVFAALVSTLQTGRLLKYAVRSEIKARVLFTMFWSALCTAVLVYANTAGDFSDLLVQHALCVGSSLVVLGWLWSAQGVIGFRSTILTFAEAPPTETKGP